MFKVNFEQLVESSVIGSIVSPKLSTNSPYHVTPEGVPLALPRGGGITYNIFVGDNIWQWRGDHIEPAVSIKNIDNADGGGLSLMTCIGNEAKVVSGDAKGAKGIVTGKHGGCNHVIIDFTPSAMGKMAIGDKIQVRSIGQGIVLSDFPEVSIMNVSPTLFKKLPLSPGKSKGSIKIKVTHEIPACIMGSGLGSNNTYIGDYDIQLNDEHTVKKFGLDSLCFGDIVAITDADNTFGRIWRKNAISVGVVIHGGCIQAGHGPGFVTLLTSKTGKIEAIKDRNANIGRYLKLGRYRKNRK